MARTFRKWVWSSIVGVALALINPAAALGQTSAIPLSTLPPAPQSGTLANGVGFSVNRGSWHSLQGYTFTPGQSPQIWTFDVPVSVRFGLRGLNGGGECFRVPVAAVVESISPNHSWDPATRLLCASISSQTADSIFTTAGLVTGLQIEAVGATVWGRGPGFIEVTVDTGIALDKEIIGPALFAAGSTINYSFLVTNTGDYDLTSVTVADPLPGMSPPACPGTTLAPGASMTCTASYVVTAADESNGFVTNTATTTGNPPGMLPQVSAQDTVTVTAPSTDLAITKIGTPNPYTPNAPFTYTIVASNLGPGAAAGAVINDPLPADLAAFGWTCTGSNGGVCGTANGTGPTVTTTADLPVGASVTIVVTGTLPPSTSGTLTNTATIATPPGMTDPVPGNNSATDVNPGDLVADLRISKASTPNPYTAGDSLTYVIVVTNAGPSDAPGARVQDMLPAALAGFTWTCQASGGALCQTGSGTGDIDALVDLPLGSSATFAISGTVPAGYVLSATNTATITPPNTVRDPVPGNNTASAQNPTTVVADLEITKTQTPNPHVAGSPMTYTLLVRNLGPNDVANARVQDVLPGTLTDATWTCAASGGGASCASVSGAGVIDAFVTLPSGTSATFTVSATAPTTATLINTATVTPPTDVTDPNLGNNTSTVVSGPAPEANLSIVKTAPSTTYVPGTSLTFTLVASNTGPDDAPNARVLDIFPPPLSGFTWTCAPSAGAATCGGVASGTSLIDVLVNLPAGGAVTFTATGIVPADTTGLITNTATVTPPLEVRDPDLTDNISSVTLGPRALADLQLTKTSTPNPYVPGLPITYTIVVTNAGPGAAIAARVQDGLPVVLQNVTWTCAATNATCPAPSGTGNVDALVDIDPGGTVTFTIIADVPAGTTGSLTNAATILPPAGTEDPSLSNNSAVNTNPSLTLGPTDLQITQEFPSVAPPNGLLTFRLRTRNLGGNPALNPYITGLIPPGTTFVSANPGPGGTCNVPGDPPPPDRVTGYPIPGAQTEPLRCTWPGLMQIGESHVVEFTVRVAPGTPTGQILWSCFWTWSDTEDPYHANNVVDAYLFVDDGLSPVGDLAIQAGAMANGAVGTELAAPVGEPMPMRFWVTNHGPAAVRGQYALILDTADTLQIVDVQVPQGWVSPSGPASGVWDTGLVQPGQTVALDLTVRVLTPSAVKLFAQRITGTPGDPNASNEHAEIVLDGYGPAGTAGRWVAVGDVHGLGAGQIITGAGQGETPQIRVFTGGGADTGVRFFAYDRRFTGGARIASCDVDGDAVDELITAPGPGMPSAIRVLTVAGTVVTELTSFDAFEASFTGGAYVACADLDGDGAAELVVGAGPGRAPEVKVFNVGVNTATEIASFLAYESGFQGGVRVAAGAYPGRPGWLDGFGIATMPGPGRAAELRLWSATGAPAAQVVVSSATQGVLPTLGDINGDGQLDLILSPDDGRPELVRIFTVDTGQLVAEVPGNLPGFPVGIRTAVGTLDGGPGQPEIVIGNGAGGHPRVRVIYWSPAGPVQRLEILPLEIP